MQRHLSGSVTIDLSADNAIEEFTNKVAELEEMDTDALLTIAYYSFLRTDSTLKGLNEDIGKEVLAGWMDEQQLRAVLKIALGMNRFDLPSRQGAM